MKIRFKLPNKLRLMLKILLLLLTSVHVSAQVSYVIDTIYKSDSERFPVSANEYFRYHYFVNNEDIALPRNKVPYDKYHPFRRMSSEVDGKYIDIEDLINVRSDQTYDFIFPFAFYKLRYDRLFEHGLQIENKFGTIEDFGKELSIVLNFYHNERAVHYIDLDDLQIKGSQLITINESTRFDRIELIIQNRWKDTLRMNFILSEH